MLNNKTHHKIAHVVGSLNVGGAERFVIDLCVTQKSQGFKSQIVSLGQPGEQLEQECKSQGIEFFSSKLPNSIKLLKMYFWLRKFDVVHIHTPHGLKFLFPILSLLNKRIIYTRHGAAPLAAGHWKKLHVKAQSFISAITFVSQEGMDNFQNQHCWSETSSHVIDNGVLITPIQRAPKTIDKLRVGSVGRMIPLKNQIGLLRAIALMSEEFKPQVEAHFFGNGQCEKELKDFARSDLKDVNICFHGMVSDREKIYSSFDLLVVTSETEGLSMVIIEAMANKIPVIATNVGGNPKLVKPNQTGWLFEYGDDQQLSQLIKENISPSDGLQQIGEQAANYIKDNFSIEGSAKKYAELYLSQ